MRLVAQANFAAFPARLAHQPIFYPVLNLDYAREIAKNWNTNDGASGFIGFVLRFEIEDSYAVAFPVRAVGGPTRQELWVPAEELTDLNHHIRGPIVVLEAYPGPQYQGAPPDAKTHLPPDLLTPAS